MERRGNRTTHGGAWLMEWRGGRTAWRACHHAKFTLPVHAISTRCSSSAMQVLQLRSIVGLLGQHSTVLTLLTGLVVRKVGQQTSRS